MGVQLFISSLTILCLLSAANSQSGVFKDNTFHVSLDQDSNYQLSWTFDPATQIMTFFLQAKTTGWIGFGISPYTGQMPGSDVIIGWVDQSGKAYLQDRFAEGRYLPSIDSQQDYHLISGREVNGTTELTFWRKFNTNDNRDIQLETGTTRLIWSYHRQDPTSETDIPIHQKMGSRSVNLFERLSEADKPKLPDDTQTFDILTPNVTVPNQKTTYWCFGMKMLQLEDKHHIIKVSPVIKKGNEGVVHHMVIFECEADEKNHGYSSECSSKNMPYDLQSCRGGSVLVVWAVGGEDIIFPRHAGFPIGGRTGPKFVVVEMHYDNPEKKSGIIDSSGVRLYYTKQLRQNDIGVLTTGHPVVPTMIIPEKQDLWHIYGYCPQHCTERGLPKTGINVFASFLHTHLAGTALSARHFRNGKELPMLAENKHYDFNYQEILYFRKEVKMLPGDSLALTCTYSTKDRDTVTISGLETRDEMCLNYLYYYPKMQFTDCETYIRYELIYPILVKLAEQNKIELPTGNSTRELENALRKVTINDPQIVDQLRHIQTYPSPGIYCTNHDHSYAQEKFPMLIPNHVPLVNYTKPSDNGATSLSIIKFISLFSYVLVAMIWIAN